MSPTLTLRHYLEAPIAHSHDHAQLVFGLSGHLDLKSMAVAARCAKAA